MVREKKGVSVNEFLQSVSNPAVYAAGDLASARVALDRFYRWCDGVQILELSRLARTVRAWQNEILAWHFTAGCSN